MRERVIELIRRAAVEGAEDYARDLAFFPAYSLIHLLMDVIRGEIVIPMPDDEIRADRLAELLREEFGIQAEARDNALIIPVRTDRSSRSANSGGRRSLDEFF